MAEELLSLRGKPVTLTLTFRMPVSVYPEIKRVCEGEGKTISKRTCELWLRELGVMTGSEIKLQQTREGNHG